MKLSLNWIKDYIDLPDDLELSKIAYDLTMSTVEVEDMIDLGAELSNIVVGLVKEVIPHPNADKLRICKTDIGGGDIREIVCGGCNLSAGMKVAVAKPGAMVRWHGEGDLVEIKNAKLRGVESYGMICASSEIGLFDLFPYTEEATIVDLSGFDAEAGAGLAQVLGLDDVILEIDNKSLTNRPDLWGHYGVARELSALYDLPLKELAPYEPPTHATGDFSVSIDDTQRCSRYIGLRIEGVAVKPSPFDVQTRIWRVGMRPINAIVDITNYVMLATGQPTHAFDSDIIKGHIIVRRAREAEKLLLLDGKELSLSPEDLAIADEESPVALAGVMGGKKDSILPDTNKVILEIANFNALGVRKTAGRHEVRTEAATRFEKGIDPERGDGALSLAMTMFAELFPGMTVTGFHDNYPGKLKRSEIDVSSDWLIRRLGKRIPDEEITGKLERLGFTVKIDGDRMHITAPSWRSTGDVSIPEDIIEEVARMHGFDKFEATSIPARFDGAINQLDVDIDRKIREYLALRCGMNEVFTYPWVHDEYIKAILASSDGMLEMASPPSPDERFLRSSLLPNLCKAVADNQHHYNEFAIFESAQIFFDNDYIAAYDPREFLPLQRRNIAGAFVCATSDSSGGGDGGGSGGGNSRGNSGGNSVGLLFRKVKGILENLPGYVHIEPFGFGKIMKPVWADDVVWLNLTCGEHLIGNLALLAKKAALDCGVKNSSVMLFELDIDSLQPYPSRTNRFTHLPEYPSTDYDISVLVDGAVKWGEIYEAINANTHEHLRSVSFVDEYRGRQVPEGKKSVTIRLVIGSLNKTLTSDEIEACAGSIVKRLKKTLGAELRG